MSFISDVFVLFSQWMRDSLLAISMAMVATILIVFGNDINSWLRTKIKNLNFFLRLTIFICLCAFGYGLLAIMAAKVLEKILSTMNNSALSPIVIIIFVLIGIIAERKNHM